MTALDGILSDYEDALSAEQMTALRERLLAREDNMAGIFFLAAQQYGMYPQIVAEVVAEAGLGTPPSEEERDLIRRNFVALMEELQEAWRRAHGGEEPGP